MTFYFLLLLDGHGGACCCVVHHFLKRAEDISTQIKPHSIRFHHTSAP